VGGGGGGPAGTKVGPKGPVSTFFDRPRNHQEDRQTP
jgi:hypothetical protein